MRTPPRSPRTLSGFVTGSTGAVSRPLGNFGVVRTGTGTYLVTPPPDHMPLVGLEVTLSGATRGFALGTAATAPLGALTVTTLNSAGTAADLDFHFVAHYP